jgi:membrane-associated phospholipid phosphatase
MRHEHGIGVRLTVAAGGAIALLVPAALIGVLIVGNVGWLHLFDLHVTAAGHELALRHPALVRFMAIWSLVFDSNSWRAAALVLAIWLIRRRAWPLAVWVAVTMTAGGVLGALLKLLVGRHRPDLLDPVARASGYSFPSGHALDNALAASVFLLVLLPLVRHRPRARVLLWIAAVVIPLVTGLSRIGLGVHWTSDVVAGWLLGVAITATMAWAYLTWQGRRGRRPHVATEGLQPEIADGEAGVGRASIG